MTDRFGLQPGEIDLIINILKSEPAVEEARIFGSRAMGNFKNGSDVDIALKGPTLNLEKITRLSFLLNEESVLPYKFDLVNYNSIRNTELTSHINRVGLVIIP